MAQAGLAASLPVIISISAPKASSATSACTKRDQDCHFSEECCEGLFCMNGDAVQVGICTV